MPETFKLKIAEPENKDKLLALIDELREQVVNNEIVALVAIPVMPDRVWGVHMIGEITALEISGMLGRAWFNANAQIANA